MRRIVIINEHRENAQNAVDTMNAFMANSAETEITVCTREPDGRFDVKAGSCSCSNVVMPPELDTEPKIRNWVNARNSGFDGFLHVLSDSVRITSDPAAFVSDLERMMTALDYPLWLSTCTDGCNYVYSKYNPRMTVSCDRPECAKLGLSGELCFTSHSNTQWVAYDMRALRGSDLLRFEERFTIPMFFIIELLARRRRTKPAGSLFYMNQYLTVGSERGVVANLREAGSEQPDQGVMQAEDALFREICPDFASDNNIDAVLEALWEKILSKSGDPV